MPRLSSTTPAFPWPTWAPRFAGMKSRLAFKGNPFPETEPYAFGILVRDGIEIMLQQLEGYDKPDLYQLRADGIWDVYIRMDGVKDFYESVREHVESSGHLKKVLYAMGV